jgi:hypothetical protein
MPGGRLTQQDRRRIAAGLAAGLGYAEIARRIARPTSTVSREVTRNGGPTAYRADGAHRATRQRARRHIPPADPAGTGTLGGPGNPGGDGAVRGFTERFAELMVETGMPRMAARVFAALSTSDTGTLTAADLVRLLEVSPASVSGAVGYLANLDLIVRRRDEGRRERYAVDGDIWMRSWLVSARQHARWAETAREGVALLGAGTPAGERLAGMAAFFDRLSADMSAGPIPAEAIDDLLTVVAALTEAAIPLTVDQLSVALGWSSGRTAAALGNATTYPEITDPIAIHATDAGCVAGAAANRLGDGARVALARIRGGIGEG